MTFLRVALISIVFVVVASSVIAEEPIRLIAHRGGVVTDVIIENNLSSIEAAVERGYWMVEVDIRRSRDNVAVAHHDANFRRYYGDPRRLSEMTWDEITELRAEPGGERPLTFAEYVAACDGRLRLMLDIKGKVHPQEYVESIEETLVEHNLLASTYVIGSEQVKQHLLDQVHISRKHDVIFAAAERGEDVARRYFLFERGGRLAEAVVQQAMQLGVHVVPSINSFNYRGQDRTAQAREDIERLLSYGVTEFQIDSVYDQWLILPDTTNESSVGE